MNNLYDVSVGILEFVEGNTGLKYHSVDAPRFELLADNDNPYHYMCWIQHSSDYYNQRKVQPTALVFNKMDIEFRCEVEPACKPCAQKDFEHSENVSDYALISDRNDVSIVAVTFQAYLEPHNKAWNHIRNFHFRNGNLRYVD